MKIFILMALAVTIGFASIGKIVLKKGDVFIKRDNQNLSVKNGTNVLQKDIIITGKNGRAQVRFEDATVITIGTNSSFKIEEYINSDTEPKASFSFAKGAFKSITGKIGKIAPENFKLKTKTATIGIRGTIVIGSIKPEGDIIACVQGEIAVKTVGIPQPVIVPAGKFTKVQKGIPPKPPLKLTPQIIKNISSSLKLSDKNGNTTKEKPTKKTKTKKTVPNQLPIQEDEKTTNTVDTTQAQTTVATIETDEAPLPVAVYSIVPETIVSDTINDAILDEVSTNVINESAEVLGVEPDKIVEEIENQECPAGTTGVFPDCNPVCPEGTTGTYPDCGTCDPNTQTGVYPNCVDLTCPEGTTGTYPDCGTCDPNTQTGVYPNCVDLTCPEGTTGTYPDCGTCDPNTQTGTYPNCVDLTCPEGTTGTYPDCGTCDPNTQTGVYPNCVDLTCPEGTTGTYPDCTTVDTGGDTGGGSTASEPNEARDINLNGQIIAAFDESGYFYGMNSDTNYTLKANTFTGNNALYFYTPDGDSASTSSIDLNWSVSLSLPEASNVYTGFSSYSGIPLNISDPEDNNTTVISATSTIYADSKQEFFINYVQGDIADYNSSFHYIETGGVYSKISNLNDDTFFSIIKYTAPYDQEDSLWINNTTKNFLHIEYSVEDHYTSIALGRVEDKGDGYLTLFGSSFNISNDFVNQSISESLYGHIYGSEFQGVDIFGVSTDQNGTNNVEGFAGYLDTKEPYHYNPLYLYYANVPLTGYANSILDDGTMNTSASPNFTYDISIYTGSLNSEKIMITPDYIINLDDSNSYSSYIDNHLFATYSTDDGSGVESWLISLPDDFINGEFVTWGYYGYFNNGFLVNPSPWVAGSFALEAATYIDRLPVTSKLYYQGVNLGCVKQNDTLYPIDMDSDNLFRIAFEFGTSTPIVESDSIVQFNAGDSGFWQLHPSNNNAAIENGTFSSSFNDTNITGDLNGTFYGYNAENIGGTFYADIDSNSSISAVFKADKTSSIIPPDYFSLTGFATSSYSDSNSTKYTINDTLSITFEGNSTIYGNLSIYDDDNSSPAQLASIDLNSSSISYVISSEDFNLTDLGSISGTGLSTESDYNDYVSWGYWSSTNLDDGNTTLQSNKNFWVAGKDADLADDFIKLIISSGAATSYTYSGQVLGAVFDGTSTYDIDPSNDTTNSVQLKFDFGGGSGSIDTAESWIKFTANNKLWDLTPSAENISGGDFSGTISQGDSMDTTLSVTTGMIQGKFYGNQAQAVGGVFKATASDSSTGTTPTATGVFKANLSRTSTEIIGLSQ